MPDRPLLVYYECLDRALDASYYTPITHLQGAPIDLLVIDSFSDSYQFQVAQSGIKDAQRTLLVVDSRNGTAITGLTQLLNPLRSQNGDLYWLGQHSFADKALRMLDGKQIPGEELPQLLEAWISQS